MDKTLNDFQTQLSESFYSKIHLLEKIIGDKHWLTSGTFKEKVLISFLNQNLPRRFKAKSGFVIFPKQRSFKNETPEDYDYLNRSSYTLSKQIDVLIFDTIEACPVFEDENIVLLAPEAVKGLIEVKGTLNRKHFNEAVNLLMDYKDKWIEYKAFSTEHSIDDLLLVPSMYIYSWEFNIDKKDKRGITGKYIREKLADLLKRNSDYQNYSKIPNITSVYIYNEIENALIVNIEETDHSVGYLTHRGQSIVFSNDGIPSKGGDKTLFSLLRGILVENNYLKNRFLIDTDDSNRTNLFAHVDTGYAKAFDIYHSAKEKQLLKKIYKNKH
jgi:hypothetical protein